MRRAALLAASAIVAAILSAIDWIGAFTLAESVVAPGYRPPGCTDLDVALSAVHAGTAAVLVYALLIWGWRARAAAPARGPSPGGVGVRFDGGPPPSQMVTPVTRLSPGASPLR